MTPKERFYLQSLAGGFGMSEKDALILARLYGVTAHQSRWNTATVERVAGIIQAQGPSYQLAAETIAKAEAEWKALRHAGNNDGPGRPRRRRCHGIYPTLPRRIEHAHSHD